MAPTITANKLTVTVGESVNGVTVQQVRGNSDYYMTGYFSTTADQPPSWLTTTFPSAVPNVLSGTATAGSVGTYGIKYREQRGIAYTMTLEVLPAAPAEPTKVTPAPATVDYENPSVTIPAPPQGAVYRIDGVDRGPGNYPVASGSTVTVTAASTDPVRYTVTFPQQTVTFPPDTAIGKVGERARIPAVLVAGGNPSGSLEWYYNRPIAAPDGLQPTEARLASSARIDALHGVPTTASTVQVSISSRDRQNNIMSTQTYPLHVTASGQAPPPDPVIVTPAAPSFDDAANTVTIPAVTGVAYRLDGVLTATGTRAVADGLVVVTAESTGSPYVVAEGAVTSWPYTFTTPGTTPPPDPEPVPDPNMGDGHLGPLYDRLAQRACKYIGRDPGTLDAPTAEWGTARQQVAVVMAFVHGYTRGHGFKDERPNTALQIVIVSALSRLVQNPEQVSYYSTGDYSEKGAILNGWTLPERGILNNYRRTWA